VAFIAIITVVSRVIMTTVIRRTIRTRYRVVTIMAIITAWQRLAMPHINRPEIVRIMAGITIVCRIEWIMILALRV
jgi:hypothetical protein